MKPPHENYASCDATTLAADDFFKEWVRTPTPDSEAYWLSFLEHYPHKQSELNEAKKIVESLYFELPDLSEAKVRALKNRIETTIQMPLSPTDAPVIPLQRRKFLRIQWIAAACMVLLSGIVGYWYYQHPQHLTYATTYGQTREISLPDGSIVTLNANSKIEYDSDFFKKNIREVWLTGEAFFSVKHTATHSKFRVHTNDLEVEVLGTEFNVSNRHQTTKVVLTSGKVQINAPDKSATLRPGDMAEFSPATRQLTQRQVKTELYSSWKEKIWLLEDESMTEVAQRIEDTFGVEVIFENPQLAQEKISGTISTGSLEEVSEIMGNLLKTNFELANNKLIIK